MKKTTCDFTFCVAIVAVLAGLNPANAQNLISANPADRGDARAGLVNPALAVWQDPTFSIGSKVLYPGISEGALDLRNNYFSLTTSNRSLGRFEAFGYGLQGQVLQTPMYNEVAINAIFGKKVHDKIAAAMNLGFANRAFDRGRFRVEDEDDPLFNRLSKWVFPDIGFGVVAVPNRYVTLAASATHLTRPNVSVDKIKARILPAYRAGIAVGFGYFRALVDVAREEHKTLPAIAVESFRPELGFLKIGFDREAATFEGLVYVMRGVSLNYRYNYPINELRLASSGSHELGLVFNFRRNRSLYDAEWLEPEAGRWRPIINPATAFVVESVFDTLNYLDKYIYRKVDSTITAKELAELPENLFFSGDSLEPDLPKIGADRLMSHIEAAAKASKFEVPSDSTAIVFQMERDHTKNYLGFLRNLAGRMKEPEFRTRLVIPADAKRAYLLLKYLSLYGPLTNRITIAVLDSGRLANDSDKLGGRKIPPHVSYRNVLMPPDTFKFHLNLKDQRWGPVLWAFVLEDVNGKVLIEFSGQLQILRRYIWDWRLSNGHEPEPGTYYYYLRWKSGDGQVYTSPKKTLVVKRDQQNITIKIARRKDFTPDSRAKATMILSN